MQSLLKQKIKTPYSWGRIFYYFMFHLMHKGWTGDSTELIPRVFIFSPWCLRQLMCIQTIKTLCWSVWWQSFLTETQSWTGFLTSLSIVLLTCSPDLDFYDVIIITPAHPQITTLFCFGFCFFPEIFWTITTKYIWMKSIDAVKLKILLNDYLDFECAVLIFENESANCSHVSHFAGMEFVHFVASTSF